jgi:alpha-tubulin N-acetyltransferase 1
LKTPITSYEKFLASDHTLLLSFDEKEQKIMGYLKYGHKNLFFYQKDGKLKQIEQSLCLLDFFVLEDFQRKGIGRQLFDAFLQVRENESIMTCSTYLFLFLKRERVDPKKIAYDRPSNKLIPFLARHYALDRPDQQPNRFTIFPGFL